MNQGVTVPITVEKLKSPFHEKLEKGDIVKSINGVQLSENLNKDSLIESSEFDDEFTYVVERRGRLIIIENVIQNPPRIAQVLPKSAAAAGLEKEM